MWCIGPLFVMWCDVAALKPPPPPVTAGARFCQIAQPILWSALDTRMTKEQIDEYNRLGKRLCRWGGRK